MDKEFTDFCKTQSEFKVLIDKFNKDKKVKFNLPDNMDTKSVSNLPIDLHTKQRRNPTNFEFIMSIDENGKCSKEKLDGCIHFICHKNKCKALNV